MTEQTSVFTMQVDGYGNSKAAYALLCIRLSVLSIVFYCAGYLRVELELHEQKNRINAGCLENTDLENKSVRDTSKRPCN